MELAAPAAIVLAGGAIALRGYGIAGGGAFVALGTALLAWEAAARRRRAAAARDAALERCDELASEAEQHRRAEAQARAEVRALEGACSERAAERDGALAAARAKAAALAELAREVRSSLNGILGMGGMLLDTSLGQEQRDYARTIRAAAETLVGVVDDVYDVARIESAEFQLHKKDFDLAQCIADVADRLGAKAARKGLALVCRVDPALPQWVVGDRGRVRQVLVALVENALARTDEGRLALAAESWAQADEGVTVRFSISDSGLAIPPEKRGAAFDELAGADIGRTAARLRLAVGRKIARAMGGDVEIGDTEQDSAGRGATFVFTTPFGASRRNEEPEPEPEGSLAGMRLLLIDGSPAACEAIRAYTARWNVQADCVHTATDAIELLRDAAESEPYEVVLIDADLPDIAGRDLIEVLRGLSETEGLKYVFLCSAGRVEKPTELVRLGFDAWLAKPLTPSRLCTVLLHVSADPVGTVHPRVPAAGAPGDHLGVRVLLAEDNIVDQKVTALLLARLGCEAEVASNGTEAVEMVLAGAFDLVLMDCHMPEMDGFEAARLIREIDDAHKRAIPIVALTGAASPGDRELCLASGMNDYLAKPVATDGLERAIRAWARPAGREPDMSKDKTQAMKAPEPQPILDPSVIESLKELGGDGDPGVFVELVELFLADTPRRIESLRRALADGDARALESAAHALKSSCGNLGAMSLSGLCKEIELCGRNLDIDGAAPLVKRSMDEFGRVREALRAELG